MFEVYEALEKEHIVLQLRNNGSVVEGFDYKFTIANVRDAKKIRRFLDRERDKRNRAITRKTGGG